MLTNEFYVALASALVSDVGGSMYLAVGSGETAWDQTPPLYQRNTLLLVNEIARKVVTRENLSYLNESGVETDGPTPRLRIQATFSAEEGTGVLRECGLFAGSASSEINTGTLLSYFVHARIEKTTDMSLVRTISLDLTPRSSGPGQIATRYLGNSSSRELHDLEHTTGACQISEIRVDNRIYFGSPQQAENLGYDYCAFCFNRELSQR